MFNVMPTQVVQTIDELFPHALKGVSGVELHASQSPQLIGIVNLVKAVPPELIIVSPSDYADLVLAMSSIEHQLAIWISRGAVNGQSGVKGLDAVTVIRRVLVQCPDSYPAPASNDLLFIKDKDLRDGMSQDIGAVHRALQNAEWKAATVLAGATIEALLLWKLQEPPIDSAAIETAVNALVAGKTLSTRPRADLHQWSLGAFIEVATHLKIIRGDTPNAVRLAQNFRNLIHPGRAYRLAQACNRATAYSAVGALEHVLDDVRA